MTEQAEQAQRLHNKGYNCAQAVVCAYCDQFGLDEETLKWQKALALAWA